MIPSHTSNVRMLALRPAAVAYVRPTSCWLPQTSLRLILISHICT